MLGRGHVCQGVMHGRGYVWHGGHVGMCGGAVCMTGETATAAGGTQPTGMHSCFKVKFADNNEVKWAHSLPLSCSYLL